MKTPKETDKKALIVVAAILAALMLGCMTACAMQKAGAAEEAEVTGVEETAGSFTGEETANADPNDESEALVGEQAVPETEDEASPDLSRKATEASGESATAIQGSNDAVVAPTGQVPASSGHKHSWEPVKTPHEVIDVAAYTETQYRTEERVMCSACGEDITNGDSQGRSILQHGKAHALAGEGGGTYSSTKKVPCGTISHPAQTHVEYEITGYKCFCGATK